RGAAPKRATPEPGPSRSSAMFKYYFRLGLRSLRTHPALTALMVMAIGLGVAASMVTWSVFRATSGNPIPHKSAHLFHARVGTWGRANRDAAGPPGAVSCIGARALARAGAAKRQTALFPIAAMIVPDDPSRLPLREFGFAWYGSAFPMFDIPFLYGSGWSDR